MLKTEPLKNEPAPKTSYKRIQLAIYVFTYTEAYAYICIYGV